MDTDVTLAPRGDAAPADGAAPRLPRHQALHQHGALCRLGLPLGPCSGGWRRDIGGVAFAIEAPAGGALPHGPLLRRLLVHIFSAALAAGGPVVEVGEDAGALAARIGLDPADAPALGEQYERLLACRLTLSQEGGAGLGLFDQRGRARAGGEWRPTLRLTQRFLADLTAASVALDADVVARLTPRPLALDAYMWLAGLLARPADPARPAGAGWDELYGCFGDQGQTPEVFRAAFEDSLCAVTIACPAVVVVMGEQAVQVRAAAPRPAAAPPRSPAPPATASRPEPAEVADQLAREAPSDSRPPDARPAAAELPAVQPSIAPPSVAEPSVGQPVAARQAGRPAIALRSPVTGLAQVVWLQPANGRDTPVIEVTPGSRYDPDTVTVLALEPLVVQVSGGLYEREFERVAAWAMTNRDLIDDVWDGKVSTPDEAASRVKKVPAPGWR